MVKELVVQFSTDWICRAIFGAAAAKNDDELTEATKAKAVASVKAILPWGWVGQGRRKGDSTFNGGAKG